jgi:hypothetical protein
MHSDLGVFFGGKNGKINSCELVPVEAWPGTLREEPLE